MGRKNSIVFGFTLILMANTALGAVSLLPYTPRDPANPDVPVYQKNWVTFFLISCFTRFIQGYGDSLTISTSFSLIASQYPLEKAEYIGILEAATGFGLMIGPPIGSFMYGFFGYAWAFYVFSIIIFIVIVL